MQEKLLTVAVIGAPNVGKSTFINNFIGKKVSIVSPKPNTTRSGVMGVYTEQDVQIIFVDTPGLGTKTTKDDKYLRKTTKKYFNQVDLVIFLFDSSKNIPGNIDYYSTLISNKIAIFNKMDTIKKSRVLPLAQSIKSNYNKIFFISSLKRDGLQEVKNYLFSLAKYEQFLYDVNTTCTLSREMFIKELAVEVIFNLFDHEIPYKVSVTNVNVSQKDQTLFVEQNIWISKSQKHIFLGKIKQLSQQIRINISQHFRQKVVNRITIKIKK